MLLLTGAPFKVEPNNSKTRRQYLQSVSCYGALKSYLCQETQWTRGRGELWLFVAKRKRHSGQVLLHDVQEAVLLHPCGILGSSDLVLLVFYGSFVIMLAFGTCPYVHTGFTGRYGSCGPSRNPKASPQEAC